MTCTLKYFRMILQKKYSVKLNKMQKKYMKNILTDLMNTNSEDESTIDNPDMMMSPKQLNGSSVSSTKCTSSMSMTTIQGPNIVDIKAT